MSTRRGSVIIYCIALAAVLVVLGYGFLRSTLADTTAGDASHKVLLAQSTARMGLMRATECIVGDYAQASQSVNAGNSSTTVGPITYLDGQWRAPFNSIVRPNQIYMADHNTADERDDVSAENFVVQPLIMWASGDEATRRHAWYDRLGGMLYDGRGRYIEAGYHPTSRPAPAGPASQPTVEMRFSDLAAPVPDRAEGLFLDRNFGRVDSGDPAQDRVLARYRLRYAVGVEDLSAHLLSNPYAEGNFDPRSPSAAYRNPPTWVRSNQHAWYNLVMSIGTGGLTAPLRAEHMFLGRGNTANVDLDASNGGPVTFPLMFRQRVMNGAKQPYWGHYAIALNSPGLNQETDGIYLPTNIGGGDPVPRMDDGNQPIVAHAYGPQTSWYNLHYGSLGYFNGNTYDNNGSIGYDETQFVPSPFGRRLQKSTAGPGAWKWYEGRVDTPWYVNLLTATPRTIHCMFLAYLPPSVKSILLQSERFCLYTGKDPTRGYDTWDWNPLIINTANPGTPVQMRSRDIFTSVSSPAFSYAPPSADGISPNFQKGDTRGIEARYPGRLWNTNDNFGRDIDLDSTFRIGICSHTGQPLYYGFTADTIYYKSDEVGGAHPWTTTPPPGWGQPRILPDGNPTDGSQDLVQIRPSSGVVQRYTFEDSYWWDLLMAYTSTISTVRAAWVQFPNRTLDPYANMDAALHDPSAFDTLEEVDRLLLRQLGEDFDNPGSGAPLSQVILSNINQFRVTGAVPSNTIRMLVDKALITPDEANVMERVLNDLRMSFFGAGPQYSETFRPKDFSGDGKVHCSAYARNPIATQLDEENGIAWWKAPVGGGDGPSVDEWFSLTGCFYLGRSHYYRVFSRGAVWDNIIQTTIADQTLETVLCVDPEGNDPSDVKVLFQRWHYDRSTSHLPRQTD
jgi:hypothetical protein